jgi:RNase P/RNase MRP subunit p30
MVKKFYDLHLQVPLNNFGLAERMIKKAKWLGYTGIGVPLPPNTSDATLSTLKGLCTDSGIDLVTRTDLSPRNPGELLSQLRRNRRRLEIIAVSCQHKPIARQAAKDRRVDLLSFPAANFRNRCYFDDADAELANSGLASLEIDMSSLLSATSFERIHLLAHLRRETKTSTKFSVPIVLSSGATAESLMRKPQDLAALAYLFDMPSGSATRAVSENPASIVRRNRAKLLPNFVAPGIRVVKQGDC